MNDATAAERQWTFLTNHARVLVQIARDPGIRVRDIATRCLLTERAVQRIITDLEQAGYLSHERRGRTNHYSVLAGKQLRHPADAGPTVAELLATLLRAPGDGQHHPAPAVPEPAGPRSADQVDGQQGDGLSQGRPTGMDRLDGAVSGAQ
ncbi:helix-turn-helix transcriptional regulator [Kitasatospora aureofaciens]|uniref:helix-turn-helix transcriptional regulator n=1 Tax=Kitasatospora aureofaciens TaxID=1894 RepID=UPI0037C5E85D